MTIKVVYNIMTVILGSSGKTFPVVKLLCKKLRIGFILKCGLIMFCNPWYNFLQMVYKLEYADK